MTEKEPKEALLTVIQLFRGTFDIFCQFKRQAAEHLLTTLCEENLRPHLSILKKRMVPADQLFCDKEIAQITLDIKIV